MVSTSLIFDAADRDPEVLLKSVENSVRNIYANGVARDGGSIFSQVKGRGSAVMASSGFRGSWDLCYKPGHKGPVFIFCESLADDHYVRTAPQAVLLQFT